MIDVEKLILNTIRDNPGITPMDLKRKSGKGKSQVYRVIETLEKDGSIVKHAFNSDKVTKVRYKLYVTPENEPLAKCVEIKIQPDLAAMWLVSSKPHWETRSIQIRRSIGLGLRQSMC